MGDRTTKRKSAFDEAGLDESIAALKEEIQALYLEDQIPWVVGYSGGKDSTATLQIVWMAIQDLPAEHRQKPVHVISTDTLVENPVVSAWVTQSLRRINHAAEEQELPIRSHQLTPQVQDTFWVNLIGRGYPVPGVKFRWCTERMKIKPANRFIADVVKANGEAIMVLGTRKAESSKRMHRMLHVGDWILFFWVKVEDERVTSCGLCQTHLLTKFSRKLVMKS